MERLSACGADAPRLEATWLLMHATGWTKAQVLVRAHNVLPPDVQTKLDAFLERRQRREPIQYILEEAEFYGLTFRVSSDVLIPRPETEELVEAVVETIRHLAEPRVLDIGTGSGCIAVTLQHLLPHAQVWACDVSEAALILARANAERLNLSVKCLRADVLHEKQFSEAVGTNWDAWVANPPYILAAERADLQPEVRDFEPQLALFVENDPLLFYRAIARQARQALKSGGWLWFECHTDFAEDVTQLLQSLGFAHARTQSDAFGLPRMSGGQWL